MMLVAEYSVSIVLESSRREAVAVPTVGIPSFCSETQEVSLGPDP